MYDFYQDFSSIENFKRKALQSNKFRLETDSWKDYRHLIQAIRNGDKDLVKNLLQNGAPVNKVPLNCNMYTPLHFAVILGCPEIVKLLLDKDVDTDIKNTNNETALIMAAKMEKYLITDYLLSVENQKNLSNSENFTHLHIACMRNKVDVVSKLIKQGAKINDTVKQKSLFWPGFTPLHFAVRFQCIETVQFLLDCGADITLMDVKQLTPLHYADMLRNEILIDMILSFHQYEISNPKNSEGLSHFHIACTRNNPLIVEHFLELGVDINLEIDKGSLNWSYCKPIHFALYYECLDVIRLLLLYGAHLDRYHIPDCIEYAYKIANQEMVDIFLSRNTIRNNNAIKVRESLDYENAKNLSKINKLIPGIFKAALKKKSEMSHSAAERIQRQVVNLLLQHDGISMKDSKGKTPIHHAFECKSMDIVDKMLSQYLGNKNDNLTDENDLSIFHISCTRSNSKVIKTFLENGVNINSFVSMNSRFWSGYTALHFAIEFNRNKTAKLLLINGADITVKNALGLTPLDIAMENALTAKLDGLNNKELKINKSIQSILLKENVNFDNEQGGSLLHLACINGDINGVKQFLNVYPEGINEPYNRKSKWLGYTPLHFAAYTYSIKVIELLISNGASISSKNAEGNTPLHVSLNSFFTHSLHNFYESMKDVRLFYTNDDPIENDDDTIENDDDTIENDDDTIENDDDTIENDDDSIENDDDSIENDDDTIENDDDTIENDDDSIEIDDHEDFYTCIRNSPLFYTNDNPMGNHGYSHFHIACIIGNIKAVKYFLELGVDVNEAVKYGSLFKSTYLTPIELAICYAQNLDVIQLLIQNGADVKIRDNTSNTLLHYIRIDKNTEKIVKILLDQGLDVNDKNLCNETPLHTLMHNADHCYDDSEFNIVCKIIELYLENGADINIENEEKKTPLTLISEWSSSSDIRFPCVEKLMQHAKKLEIINAASEKNTKALLDLHLLRQLRRYQYKENHFVHLCSKELEQMMKINISYYTTLHDILFHDINKMSIHSKNESLQKIVKSTDLSTEFPIYGFFLKSQFKKGLIRRYLIEFSKISWNDSSFIPLPEVCLEKIFHYLDNDDLKNIILST